MHELVWRIDAVSERGYWRKGGRLLELSVGNC